MTWFKVDDSFYDHPKVYDAPDCAVALWTRAGTWSARNLTEGFVPTGLPARLCGDPDTAVKELVRRGLWSRTAGGFQFHDWAKYQPSRDAVEDLRTKRAEAGRKGGRARAARYRKPVDKPGDNSPVGNGDVTEAQKIFVDGRWVEPTATRPRSRSTSRDVAKPKQVPSNSQASASPVAKQNATPSRPLPSTKEGRDGRPPATRGGADGVPDPTWLDDPTQLAEYRQKIAAIAEQATRDLAEESRRARNGAAAARAALAKTRLAAPEEP